MIPVAQDAEPAAFEEGCRKPGNDWLAANLDRKKGFRDYWTAFWENLAEAFHDRCGWWAMRIECGEVDHFLSKSKPAHRTLIYEWSNYRYIAPTVNKSKGTKDDRVLDPFEVEEGWFEVLLPSLELVVTRLIPAEKIDRARFTLRALHLARGAKVRRNRRRWYEDYKAGRITKAGLVAFAPLVAEAVQRREAAGLPLP